LLEVDVVITGRGGGSVEDLWAFNEEVVARAIYDSPIPVVSAVGHEIDVSIADLVADRRALTPSEAGELVVPLLSEVQQTLDHIRRRMTTALQQQAQRARLTLDNLRQRRCFAKPLQRVHDLAARLDELEGRLQRGLRGRVETSRQQLATLAASLDALSPLGVLKRGYSLTKRLSDGQLVRDAGLLSPGDAISTLLASGSVVSRVERVERDDE
jgi:exodeoxyribonuclease VII large subunit